jgi:hypothetical protein
MRPARPPGRTSTTSRTTPAGLRTRPRRSPARCSTGSTTLPPAWSCGFSCTVATIRPTSPRTTTTPTGKPSTTSRTGSRRRSEALRRGRDGRRRASPGCSVAFYGRRSGRVTDDRLSRRCQAGGMSQATAEGELDVVATTAEARREQAVRSIGRPRRTNRRSRRLGFGALVLASFAATVLGLGALLAALWRTRQSGASGCAAVAQPRPGH